MTIPAPSAPDFPPFVNDDDAPEARSAEVPVATPPLRKIAGQTPPHDLDAEAVVLGQLLADPKRLLEVQGLEPRHFYSDANRIIYATICLMADGLLPIDALSVKAKLSDDGTLLKVGGAGYLGQLVSDTPACQRLAEQAERIRARAELRRLIFEAQRVAASGYMATDAEALRVELVTAAGPKYSPIGTRRGPELPWLYGGALAQPIPEHPWAIPGLQLGPGRPAMIVAYAGTAKTIAMQSALLAYAAGRNVWGAFPTNRGGVALHLDYEQGSNATRRRYQRIAYGLGVTLEEVGGRIGVVSFPKLYLTDKDAESAFEREIDGAGLVLGDSLRAMMPGVDENDSAVRRYVDMLTRISERTGCAIVLIHHSGKEKIGHSDKRQVARGSSALLDAVGCSYLLTMTSYDEPRGICQTKMPAESDGTTFPDAFLAIEDVPGPEGAKQGLRITYQTAEQADPEQTPKQVLVERMAQVLMAVKQNPGCSLRVLRAMVKGGRDVFEAAIECLEKDGAIRVDRAKGEHGGGGLSFWFVDGSNGGDEP
jgi:hypothetical protein